MLTRGRHHPRPTLLGKWRLQKPPDQCCGGFMYQDQVKLSYLNANLNCPAKMFISPKLLHFLAPQTLMCFNGSLYDRLVHQHPCFSVEPLQLVYCLLHLYASETNLLYRWSKNKSDWILLWILTHATLRHLPAPTQLNESIISACTKFFFFRFTGAGMQ